MSQRPVTTKIKSVLPPIVESTYTTTPLGYDESGKLALRLSKITAKPLGDLFGGLMSHLTAEDTVEAAKAADAGELAQLAADQADSENALEGIEVGDILAMLVDGIIAEGGMDLVAEIFAQTIRHTPAADKESKAMTLHLKDSLARDRAYAGGNQAESVKAIGWVLMANYAPFLMERFQSSAGALGLLRGALASAPQT